MFSLSVVDTDKFMDMPSSTQALYFHLGMHGDDDGFVASPRKICRAAGCNDDDIRLLITKGFLIPFESGVVVITDWRINNALKNDRYRPTIYQEEKALIQTEKSGKYIAPGTMVPESFQNGSKTEPQHNVTKHNITEHNRGEGEKADKPPARTRFLPPAVEDVRAYCKEQGYAAVDPERFVAYYTSNGWMVGKNKMKDWKAAARSWNSREQESSPAREQNSFDPFPEVPTL